jgi:hypothetical protein
MKNLLRNDNTINNKPLEGTSRFKQNYAKLYSKLANNEKSSTTEPSFTKRENSMNTMSKINNCKMELFIKGTSRKQTNSKSNKYSLNNYPLPQAADKSLNILSQKNDNEMIVGNYYI